MNQIHFQYMLEGGYIWGRGAYNGMPFLLFIGRWAYQ